MSGAALCEVRGLGKVYVDGRAEVQALSQVSLTVRAGECIGVVGPSGCGKSTLIKMLGLIIRPSSGSLLINGEPAPEKERERARLRNEFFGHIEQELAVIDDETAESNVAIPLEYAHPRLPKRERRHRARDVLEQVGIGWAASERAGRLSGGERQRVAIARALANEPTVILADEPTSALDRANVSAIMDLLLTVPARGGAVIVATHDHRVASRCSRVVELEDGRLTPQ